MNKRLVIIGASGEGKVCADVAMKLQKYGEILFLEDDGMAEKAFMWEFDRNLQSLLHCYKNKTLKGLIIGRAQLANKMTVEKIYWMKKIILEAFGTGHNCFPKIKLQKY